MSKMLIEYWSDFICPYCYIAKQRMKNVKKELNIIDKFEFKLLSYELEPNAPKKRELNIVENYSKKYSMSIEQAKQEVDHINQLGKQKELISNMILVEEVIHLKLIDWLNILKKRK